MLVCTTSLSPLPCKKFFSHNLHLPQSTVYKCTNVTSFKSCSMDPQNIIVGCSKGCTRKLIFTSSSQHPTVILWEPTLPSNAKNACLCSQWVHPKLYNINSYNITRSLISQNPRKQMFVVQIAILIVTFLSLISQNLSWMQNIKEVNPHPRMMPCVNMWIIFFFFFFHLLNVGACIRHIAQEGQAEWTTLA